MKSNIEKLGETINKRVQDTFGARTAIIAELGTVTGNLGIQVASVGNIIPKGAYLISTRLTMGEKDAEFTGTTTDSAHSHKVKLPEELRSLKAGDRVLLIWCGNEPVVTDILTE